VILDFGVVHLLQLLVLADSLYLKPVYHGEDQLLPCLDPAVLKARKIDPLSGFVLSVHGSNLQSVT